MRREESNGRSLNRRVSAKDCEQCLSCRPCLFHEHNRDYTQALSSDTLCTHKPTTAEHCQEIGTTPPRYKSPHGECAIRARTCVCSAPKYTHAKEYKDTKHTHTSGGITKITTSHLHSPIEMAQYFLGIDDTRRVRVGLSVRCGDKVGHLAEDALLVCVHVVVHAVPNGCSVRCVALRRAIDRID